MNVDVDQMTGDLLAIPSWLQRFRMAVNIFGDMFASRTTREGMFDFRHCKT